MTAFEFLKYLKAHSQHYIPHHLNGNKPIEASNTQMRRWLDMGAVQVNSKRPKSNDEVEFPVWELVWFPSSKNKISMYYSEEDKIYSERQDEAERVYQNIVKGE